jgi:hypothetical protein
MPWGLDDARIPELYSHFSSFPGVAESETLGTKSRRLGWAETAENQRPGDVHHLA